MKKNTMRKILSMFLAVALCFSTANVTIVTAEDTTDVKTGDESASAVVVSDNVKSIVAEMTTQEKIEQMLMPTFRYFEGVNVTEFNDDNAAIKECINNHAFAGVILFSENITSNAQVTKLIDAYQTENQKNDKTKPQLFMSADQEGGRVVRITNGTDFTGNMALAATGNLENVVETGKYIGVELNAVGINMNFAPDVDVNNNPSNPVIGTRSFSDDANVVATYGKAFIEGLNSTNTIATLKHFPGHGDTGTDSHTGLPCVDKSYDELMSNEFIPFKECIDAGAEMIMTAHIQYPQLEESTVTSKEEGVGEVYVPATLSKHIITDILRGDLGFNGVVITDALEMDAIAKNFGQVEAACMAIEAGVDILLIPTVVKDADSLEAFEKYISTVTKCVEDGEVDEEKVNAAVERILALKEKKGLLGEYDTTQLDKRLENVKSVVGSKEHHDAEWRIAREAITMVKNDGVLPVNPSRDSLTILNHDSDYTLAPQFALKKLMLEGKLDSSAGYQETTYADKEFEELKPYLTNKKGAVILTTRMNGLSGLTDDNSKKVDEIIEYAHQQGLKVVIISYNLPYEAARFQAADAILLAYNSKGISEIPDYTGEEVKMYGANIPAAFYKCFAEDEIPFGTLPINIPALNDDYTFSSTPLYERGFVMQYDTESGDSTPSPSPDPRVIKITTAAAISIVKSTSTPAAVTPAAVTPAATKKAQPMKVKVVKKVVKYSKLKKKKQVVKGAIIVKKNKGKVTFKAIKKGSSKGLTIKKKNGKITVKKGLKKGKYKLKVKVKAKGNANYKAGTKKVTAKIVVK